MVERFMSITACLFLRFAILTAIQLLHKDRAQPALFLLQILIIYPALHYYLTAVSLLEIRLMPFNQQAVER